LHRDRAFDDASEVHVEQDPVAQGRGQVQLRLPGVAGAEQAFAVLPDGIECGISIAR
jgi:hypothetical protein